jgi:hypothetical protein
MDNEIRTAERKSLTDETPETLLRARIARIRAGIETSPETPYTVLDPLHLVPLRTKVEKLARAATKRGALPVALVEAPEARWIERKRSDGTTTLIRVRDVVLVGDAPDAGAWRYAALLHHTPSGTILHRASAAQGLGDEALEVYRARGPICDHCETRRARHDTYILRNQETGETLQVGRQCLEAFTGCSPLAAVFIFDTLSTLTQDAIQGGELADGVNPDYGIPLTVAVADGLAVRRLGNTWRPWTLEWRGNNSPMEDQDAEEACGLLNEARKALLPSLAEERRRAVVREQGQDPGAWPTGLEALPESLHNASVVLAEGCVSWREWDRVRDLLTWYARRQQASPEARRKAIIEALQRMGLGVDPEDTALNFETDAFIHLMLEVGAGRGQDLLTVCQNLNAKPGTVSSETLVRGAMVNLKDGTVGRIFWRGRGKTGRDTVGINVRGESTPRWIEVRALLEGEV